MANKFISLPLEASSGAAILSINGDTTAAQILAVGSAGTDFALVNSGATHTFNLPIASAVNTGKLSSSDWSIFNGKQSSGNYLTALTSDVSASGPGSAAAIVNSVGGSSASNVHAAELLANAATNANTASTIVKRDASGNFSAGTITASLSGNSTNITGNLPFAQQISPQVTKALYVDGHRTDSYTADGTSWRPFKTIQAAINQIIANGDNGGSFPNLISYIIYIAPGVYQENLVMESNLLAYVTIDGGDVLSTVVEPGAGNAFQSTASNGNLIYLALKNIFFNGDFVMQGVNGGIMGDQDFILENVLVEGSVFSVKNWETLDASTLVVGSTTVTLENLWFATLANNSVISNDIGITFNAADPLGANIDSTNIRFQDGLFPGNISAGDGCIIVTRMAPRIGSPSTTLTLGSGATLEAYNGNIRGNISVNAAATFNNHGAVVDPTLVTGVMNQVEGYGKFPQVLAGIGAQVSTNTAIELSDGHLKSIQTTPPVATIQPSAGTGASCSISNATDTAGKITITTGTIGISTGSYASIAFNKAYNVAPIIVVSPASSTLSSSIYVTSSVNGFDINFAIAGGVSATYIINYHCMETQ